MYSVRIACPKCSMQQTFRGTPPEIGDAVEMWNSRHQLTAHTQATSADVKTDLTVKAIEPVSPPSYFGLIFGLTTGAYNHSRALLSLDLICGRKIIDRRILRGGSGLSW